MALKGSLKGHVFDPKDQASIPTSWQKKSPTALIRLAEAETARMAIVATCQACGEDLIAEEVLPHRLNHEHGTVRAMVQTVLNQDPRHRPRILELLTELLAPPPAKKS